MAVSYGQLENPCLALEGFSKEEGEGTLRETPFRGLSKNIDNAPRRKGVKEILPFYIWISEGIGLRAVRCYESGAVSDKIKDARSGIQQRCYANNASLKEIVVVGRGLCISSCLGMIALACDNAIGNDNGGFYHRECTRLSLLSRNHS